MKKILILLGLAIFCLGCTEKSIVVEKGIQDSLTNPELKEAANKETKDVALETCIKNAKELIPTKFLVIYNSPSKSYSLAAPTKWNNGELIEGVWAQGFVRKGSEVGENINYLYGASFNYGKEIISKDGTVLGNRFFSFSGLLRPIDNNSEEAKQITADLSGQIGEMNRQFLDQFSDYDSTYVYELTDIKFQDCDWIEEK